MSKPLSNEKIIEKMVHAAAVLEVIDTSPQKVFRVRAYQTAIESLENLDEDISQLVASGKLEEIQGIGKELSQKITDLVQNGRSSSLEKLYAQVPAGMFPLLDIPGLGPKKAYQLAREFNLSDPNTALKHLKRHIEAGDVAKLDHFGALSQAKLKQNINAYKPKSSRMLLDAAWDLAQKGIDLLAPLPQVQKVMALGSLRRWAETVGDIDLGVVTHDPQAVVETIKKNQGYRVVVAGENVIRLLFPGNRQVDIKFQTPEKWGATLQHFTGSKAHNIALREFARKQHKSLSEHGIKYHGEVKQFSSEKAFYRFLNLAYIDPRLREGTGEIEAAQEHSLPSLADLKDIRGDTHTHTDFQYRSSHDAGMPVSQLLDQCQSLNYSWVMIGDHNPSQQSHPGTLMNNILIQRRKHIEQQYYSWKEEHENSILNILIALEVDITPEGYLAVPASALKNVDVVIASVHSRFDLPRAQQTRRLLTALSQPQVKILGHPTGRIINHRQPLTADWEQIFTHCRQHYQALEINAQPRRLDLPDSLVKQAVQQGVTLSLGSDAHHPSDLGLLPYGLAVAARGWCQKRDMINTYTFKQLSQWLSRR